jgi:hypothetical protein
MENNNNFIISHKHRCNVALAEIFREDILATP